MKKVKFVVAIVAAMSVLALSCASGGGGGGGSKAAVETGPVVPVFSWNFDDPAAGTGGWVPADGHWDYRGAVTVSRDDTILGRPVLKVDLDYSRDAGSEWSEPKIRYAFATPVEIATVSRFNFDFYYNPEYKKRGSFKSKVIAMEGTREKTTGSTDALKEEPAENGWIKAKVSLRVLKAPGNMDATVLGIPGYKTDYKGPVLLDNIYWD